MKQYNLWDFEPACRASRGEDSVHACRKEYFSRVLEQLALGGASVTSIPTEMQFAIGSIATCLFKLSMFTFVDPGQYETWKRSFRGTKSLAKETDFSFTAASHMEWILTSRFPLLTDSTPKLAHPETMILVGDGIHKGGAFRSSQRIVL